MSCYSQTSPLSTCFISIWDLAVKGMSEFTLVFISEDGYCVIFLRSHKTSCFHRHQPFPCDPISEKISMGRSCKTMSLACASATHSWSQLKSEHTCDAGWKQRPKELFHSTIFYIHRGNHLQFISALWLLCKLPNVKNVATVSRERSVLL